MLFGEEVGEEVGVRVAFDRIGEFKFLEHVYDVHLFVCRVGGGVEDLAQEGVV